MSLPSLKIRPLMESDARAWWDLRLASLESDPFAFGKSVEEHMEMSMGEIALRFHASSSDYYTLGAFDSGILVGMVTFMRAAGSKECHKGYVFGVYVAPSHRSQGLSKSLLNALIETAKCDVSLEQLTLGVAATQTAAKGLYLSLGFVVYGTEPRAKKVGSTYVDEDHMILQLR